MININFRKPFEDAASSLEGFFIGGEKMTTIPSQHEIMNRVRVKACLKPLEIDEEVFLTEGQLNKNMQLAVARNKQRVVDMFNSAPAITKHSYSEVR